MAFPNYFAKVNVIYTPATGILEKFFDKKLKSDKFNNQIHCNKANLNELIAATCLVILLKLDSNRRFI